MISLNAVLPTKKVSNFFGYDVLIKKKTTGKASPPFISLLTVRDFRLDTPQLQFIVPFRKLPCGSKWSHFINLQKRLETFGCKIRWLVVQHPPWGPSQQMYQAIADPDKNPLKTPCKGRLLAQFKRLWNQPSFLLWLMDILKNSFEIKKGGMHDTSFTLCWSFRKENGQVFCSFACHQTPAKNNFACQWNGWGSTPTAILCVAGRHPTWGRQRCLHKWRSRPVASERNHPATIHNSSWIVLGSC